MKTKALLLSLFTAIVPLSASASLVTHTFDTGTDLSSWTTDRCAPEGFSTNNNELVMTLASDSACLDQDGFYHTQGMKLDIGQSTFLSVDMFVDSSWSDAGRFGGIWGVAYNDTGTISDYPILEFQIPGMTSANDGMFDAFVSSEGGWADLPGTAFNLDDWNTLSFAINNGTMDYFINDTLVLSNANSGSEYMGEVILNAFNAGNGYDVRYDNLQYGTQDVDVPAPGAGALLAMGLAMLFIRRRRK